MYRLTHSLRNPFRDHKLTGALMKLHLAILTLDLLATNPAFAADKTTTRPVIVEYFTSQGCSSCPPADAFLKDDLSKRDDVISLAYHVDYWDDLGWKDTFSQHSFTTRQYAYKRALSQKEKDAGRIGVYTPQMVVEGKFAAVGSNRAVVNRAIDAAQNNLANVPITITHKNGETHLTISADEAAATPATLWLVSYVKSAPVTIKRGENTGRTITYVNIVHDMQALGHWDGHSLSLTLPQLSNNKAYIALLQSDHLGPILGVSRVQ